jgi:hypothetical protein
MGKKSRLKKERRAQAAPSGEAGKPVPRTPKTYVGLPVYREVLPQTMVSLLSICQLFDNTDFAVIDGCYIENARNTLAEMGRRQEFDRMLFVDSDISFTIDDYLELHKALDDDPQSGAMCGMYSSHKNSDKLIVGFFDEDGGMPLEAECQERGWQAIESGDPIPVDKAGAGFMLVDMGVFEKIPPPWFNTITEAGRFWGEDTYFLQLLKQHGYVPKIHGGVVVTHTGPTPHKPELTDKTEELRKIYRLATSQNETSNEVSK